MRRIAIRRISLQERLGLSTGSNSLRGIERDIENLRVRLGSQGVDASPKPPKDSLLTKSLKALNVPGATVRGVIKAAIDPDYNLTDIEPYDNPVQGIDLLDKLGLAPAEGQGFGRKAARFGLGLATDIVTDPISLFTGGITKPLGVLRAPVFGKEVAQLTRQGLAQPFLRGLGAGIRGTGELGAALGDAGVIQARQNAQKAAAGILPKPETPLSQISRLPKKNIFIPEDIVPTKALSSRAVTQRTGEIIGSSIRNEAPRELTRVERLGLMAGKGVRSSERGKGLIQAFSPTSLMDPEYAYLQRRLRERISLGERGKLRELNKLVQNMAPDEQKLVVDLLENSSVRAQYGLENMPPLVRQVVETVEAGTKQYADNVLEAARALVSSPDDWRRIAGTLSAKEKREVLEIARDKRLLKEMGLTAPSAQPAGEAVTGFPSGRTPGTRLPNMEEADLLKEISDTDKGLQILAQQREDGIRKASEKIALAEEKAGRQFELADITQLATRQFDESTVGQRIAEQINTLTRRRGNWQNALDETARTAGTRVVNTEADRLLAQNKAGQEVSQRLSTPDVTPTNPLDVKRPGAEGTRSLFETEAVKELPENVRKSYEYAREVLDSYGNEKLKRGLLSSLMQNYFSHKLNPEIIESASGLGKLSTKQASQNYRELRKPLAEIATDPNAPQFDYQFVRPFAKEILESERAINVYDFFDEVKTQFGLTSEDLATRYGLKPNMKLPDEIHITASNEIVDAAYARANGLDLSDDQVFKLVDFEALGVRSKDAAIPPHLRQGYGRLGKVYLPKSVADDMTRLHRAYSTDEGINQFVKLWDGLTNFWRPLVTTLSPSFHVNNMLGNLWNMFLGGMDNPKRFRDGYDVFLNRAGEVKAGAHKLRFEDMHRLGLDEGVFRGIYDAELSGDVYRLAREGLPAPTSESAITKAYTKLSGGYGKAGEIGSGLGSKIEGMSRATLFVDQMIKKASEFSGELTEDVLRKFARESAEHTNKYLYDYAHGLSTFESQIMRRVVPFYSWARMNIPRQVIELIDQPGKFLLYKHAKDNLTKLNPYPDETPPWLREALPTGIQMGGAQVFLNPRLPLQDISRLAPQDEGRELLGMLNPLLKLPIELGTNRNLYTGREIQEYEGQTVPTPLGRVSPQALHTWDSLSGTVGRVATNVPRAAMEGATNVDILRGIRMFLPGLYTYDPQRQRVSNAYSEVQRLRDLMRKFEDEESRQVPTLKQLGVR